MAAPASVYCTISCTVTALVKVPLVPRIVNVYVPLGVLVLVLTVNVEDPPPVTDVGLKLADVREGSPLTENPTVPLKPLLGVTVTV